MAGLSLGTLPGLAPARAQASAETPVGLWLAYDDSSGHWVRATIRIENRGGVLDGQIIATSNPADAHKLCTACDGARKNQPILGLTIITNMHQDGARWDGGQILDPITGSVYRCIMHVEDGGRRLVVRGFIGLSLFGRSQTWTRVQ
jgi:uncharacterized protein (DUF2147 family)